ncbi:histidinol-phosphate transaminase [Nakamurella leprariae]|uniref:Aromatic amino acid aminotransferase n=1 Tax=Nakamurella leprariae TaxID=2803911 RepID=A0A938Y8S1_9ACTN|nr:histidinol-phosphate transaminase [Nakamurella leprariae]MBM9467925.1 histidinol-phosphate transaminase [Nakamurella leprariae]
MTVRFRSALDGLPAYAPGRSVPGAVKLASNELSWPTLPQVAEAIAVAAGDEHTRGINRYPDNTAEHLVSALAEHVDQPRERLVVGGGSVALCQQLVQIVAGDGDEVVFGWRSFEAYPIVTQITGARPVMVPVTGDHRLDLAALADAVTERTRLMFVCTPNNPTGTVVHTDELVELIERVRDDVLIVVDEAYREFDTDPDSADGVALAARYPNVVTLRTLSKAYQLAGLRVGYAVADPSIVTALRKVAIPFAVNSLAQVAALTALAAQTELAPRWRAVVAERDRVTAALREAGFEVPTSQANFVWLPLGTRAAAFAEHCETTEKVIVRAFPDATGGVRITIGAPQENDRMLQAARSWPR